MAPPELADALAIVATEAADLADLISTTHKEAPYYQTRGLIEFHLRQASQLSLHVSQRIIRQAAPEN